MADHNMHLVLRGREYSSILINAIKEYYSNRYLKFPDLDQALKWSHTEMGEVYELLLAKEGGWVRNNPSDHPPFSYDKLEEELGDAIMMLVVAGMAEGLDPLGAMILKMERKTSQIVYLKIEVSENNPSPKT